MTRIQTIFLAVLAAAACHAAALAQDAPAVERDEQSRTVRVPLERGGKVELGNRTTGRIVVHGWDKDYIEAVATSERGTEYVRASSERDSSGQRVFLKADYLTHSMPPIPQPVQTPQPAQSKQAPQPAPGSPPNAPDTKPPTPPASDKEQKPFQLLFDFPRGEVHLEVKLPRYAEIEVINVNRSEVEVTDVGTPITVSGNRSAIKLSRVGAVEVRTGSGPVEVEGASGLVDVTTEAGHVSVRDVRGDVRVLSLSGHVRISCVSGRVNVSNAGGSVVLAGVGGDVDATTVNSDVFFNGALRPDGRYHLKSMSGAVEMTLNPNPPGFTALLSSYRGQIEDGFSLKKTWKSDPNTVKNRVLGRYGSGQAQVTLDSFDGRVKLGKAAPDTKQECKQ